ncbi:IclR family transcriptional regulator [Pseudarthrobacter sp. 1C304]|uniref:IclR family transcriptional regulator n=1 Tax=Pseudarthrobacter sp. 1C304 TaxID=3457438 RepID=UPI003FD3E04B
MTTKEPGGTQALERAMALLACFSDEAGELRVSELCTKTGLNQSTVSRMMSALERTRLVVHDGRTGLYRLGPTAISLGSVALNGSVIYRAGRQIAQNLAQRTGLGVNIAELSDDSLYYLANFEGERSPKSFSMAGRVGPLHATAMGKALLATWDDARIRAYFETERVGYRPRTIVDVETMLSAVEDIRGRGYATEVEELTFGRACVAAPIRDQGGAAVAAMSISGSLSTVGVGTPRQAELAQLIIEACDEVSVALGYSASTSRMLG